MAAQWVPMVFSPVPNLCPLEGFGMGRMDMATHQHGPPSESKLLWAELVCQLLRGSRPTAQQLGPGWWLLLTYLLDRCVKTLPSSYQTELSRTFDQTNVGKLQPGAPGEIPSEYTHITRLPESQLLPAPARGPADTAQPGSWSSVLLGTGRRGIHTHIRDDNARGRTKPEGRTGSFRWWWWWLARGGGCCGKGCGNKF